MGLTATIHVSSPDLALTPTIRACPDVTVRVIPHSTTDVETGLFFFLVENPIEPFEAALDDDHTVAEWTLVEAADAGAVYRIRHPPEAKLVSPAALELGGLMLDAVSDGRGWVVRVQFTDREALSGLWEACESDGITFDLRRLFRHQPWGRSAPTTLTDAQRDALLAAYESGYFDEPRGISLAELADRLGISPTAVGGRVRRGTAELIEAVLVEGE
ncbi:helix-turn-helix domain-containing protein [Halococcus hamelinensis]|uniref:helix-turn-helix domain-containing protein n=1 Tax=Halococcus hamelinensis TaxID=332168 RepID=UPI00049834E5